VRIFSFVQDDGKNIQRSAMKYPTNRQLSLSRPLRHQEYGAYHSRVGRQSKNAHSCAQRKATAPASHRDGHDTAPGDRGRHESVVSDGGQSILSQPTGRLNPIANLEARFSKIDALPRRRVRIKALSTGARQPTSDSSTRLLIDLSERYDRESLDQEGTYPCLIELKREVEVSCH